MTDFNIAGGYVSNAQGALAGDTASLPFPAPWCRWMNGKPAAAEAGDARYYGGWEIGIEGTNGLAEAMNTYAMETLPFGWKEITNHSQDGSAYASVVSRVGIFVLIGKRMRWQVNPETGGKSSTAHWLTLLSTLDAKSKVYSAMFPVVITAKGYSSKYVEDAMTAFGAATAAMRREVANNAPPFLFYHPLGTNGQEPVTKMVGKGQQSPITPCDVIVPANIDRAYIERAFIGQAVADTCAGYLEEAAEWLTAWDGLDETDPTPGTQPAEADPSIYGKHTPYDAAPPEEDVPF